MTNIREQDPSACNPEVREALSDLQDELAEDANECVEVKQELVTYEEALKHVSNPGDFALRFRGIASTSDGTWDDFEAGDDDEKPEVPSEAAEPEKSGALDDDFIQRF